MPLPLDTLNRLSEADFAAAVGESFEHASWVAEAAAAKRPFGTVRALHEAMMGVLGAAPRERQLDFLRAHPDLAGQVNRASTLTRHSAREQAGAGLDSLGEEQAARLRELSDSYRARFGFPFMICVRRHTVESILAQLEQRIGSDAARELATALREVFYITRLRVAGAVSGEGMPRVNGRLSTHVLDTHAGRPAAGIAVELLELSGEHGRRIATTITDSDGRTDRPLIGGRPLPIGRYELRFAVGNHFRSRGIDSGNPPFLDIVPLRFSIAEPEGHYHIPLLCTPWSYSTYRGS